ncbi:hypothetical protein F4811DRAFT_515701 [Daldinia bambusicola]|nr:hypothetical protein F4811DRAFT_515701 [Daldinia bambusicola]
MIATVCTLCTYIPNVHTATTKPCGLVASSLQLLGTFLLRTVTAVRFSPDPAPWPQKVSRASSLLIRYTNSTVGIVT